MINKNLPTKLFLNGPDLVFTTHPVDVVTKTGIATFTGIATAAFPAGSNAVNDGSISYEWYFGGNKITDDADGDIETVGTASTLTLTGLSPEDNLKQIYVVADYSPTAYSQPTGSDVTAGTARSTGNSFNDPVQSNAAILTIDPKIIINTQPTDSIAAAGNDHVYNIEATVAPPGPTISYQWQLDGADLVDGVITTDVIGDAAGVMTIVDDATGTTTEVNFGEASVYNSFTPGKTYTIRVSSDITASLDLKGGGGGGSGFRQVAGSVGGRATGKFTFLHDRTYKIQVGEGGQDGQTLPNGNATGSGGFPGGGDAPTLRERFNRSGAGGGYTGIFLGEVHHNNSILIAGGGGGSSGDPATGGDGGGEEGNDGSNGDRAGKGGTFLAGGAAGTQSGAGTAGSALQGGKGFTGEGGGGGGGGGYYGGGGGAGAGPGTGGGGSGFKHTTLITDGVLTTGGAGGDAERGADGSFSITIISTASSVVTTTSTTVSGATTPTLTINSETGSISGVVRCVVSATTKTGDFQTTTLTHASNSPLNSNEVNFSNLIPRNVLNFEAYNDTSVAITTSYTLQESITTSAGTDQNDVTLDLRQNNLVGTVAITQENLDDPGTLRTMALSSNDICFYAPEKDMYIEMELRGARGMTYGSNLGGDGGYSKIRFTANKNDEYIIRGLESNSAVFLYRRANLIAVVGEGGAAAKFSIGGPGGGIGQAGASSGGSGGQLISEGALGENGSWGGRANPSEVYPEDDQGTGTEEGQTIKCTKGVYWRDQGVSACADLNSATAASIPASGLSQFRLSDGTIVTNSGEINRGFKAGYAINSTGGAGNADGTGKGGHGATGGRGDTGGNGGGGGSGYTDGSLTYVVETERGENQQGASVILRLASTATDPVPVPPPPEERVVRWTVSRNAGNTNTVTFSKQSGTGPSTITWGPNSGHVNTLIGAGAVYVYSSDTHSGGRDLQRRLTGNRLEIEDAGDNDYDDLTVSPSQGRFTSESRWEANW